MKLYVAYSTRVGNGYQFVAGRMPRTESDMRVLLAAVEELVQHRLSGGRHEDRFSQLCLVIIGIFELEE